MPQIARLNDPSDHGGHIASASPTFSADGLGVARLGDLHSCPIHGDTPMATASGPATADGKRICVVGDQAQCGAKITQGSPTASAG